MTIGPERFNTLPERDHTDDDQDDHGHDQFVIYQPLSDSL